MSSSNQATDDSSLVAVCSDSTSERSPLLPVEISDVNPHKKPAKDGNRFRFNFSLKDPSLWRAVFCEFFGTSVLLFFGLASILPSVADPDIDNLLAPGLCFCTVIVILVHVIGPTSGCHINPAVTLALVVVRKLHPVKGVLYLFAQLLGASAGSLYLYMVSPTDWIEEASLGMTIVNSKMGPFQGAATEAAVTMLLVLIVLVVTDDDPDKDFQGFPSLSVGLAVLACVYAAGAYTGASLNPARSFGPALVMLDFRDHWVFWLGPLGGSLVAVVIYSLFLVQGLHKKQPSQQKCEQTAKKSEELLDADVIGERDQ